MLVIKNYIIDDSKIHAKIEENKKKAMVAHADVGQAQRKACDASTSIANGAPSCAA